MYHFEGQYRSIPAQDHRGLSQRSQRNHVLSHAVDERHRRETRRTQEKNAIVIQKWARKLMAQRELCRLARSKLADIEEELSRLDKPSKAEVAALLLKYFRIAIVAFFEFAHRDIDILVKVAGTFHARKRMVLEFRERDPLTWNPVLADVAASALKSARIVTAPGTWKFDPVVASQLRSLVDLVHELTWPSPMSVAMTIVPESLSSWLAFIANVLVAVLPFGYYEVVAELITGQGEVEKSIESFKNVAWNLFNGPLYLLCHDPVFNGASVVTSSLRSDIVKSFGSELMAHQRAESPLRLWPVHWFTEVFPAGKKEFVSENLPNFFEYLYLEMNSIACLVASGCKTCAKDWEQATSVFIECLGVLAPTFVQGSKGGYWLLKALYKFMTVLESGGDGPEDSWTFWKLQPFPEPSSVEWDGKFSRRNQARRTWRKSSVNTIRKKRRNNFDEDEDMEKGSSSEEMETEDSDEGIFYGLKKFWSPCEIRLASGLKDLLTDPSVVERVNDDVEEWCEDDECLAALSWATYHVLEVSTVLAKPLDVINETEILKKCSSTPRLLQNLWRFARTMKRSTAAEDLARPTSARGQWATIWDAVQHGSHVTKEETKRFLPAVVCAAALNSYRLRCCTVMEFPEDPGTDVERTKSMSLFFHDQFVEMVNSFSSLSVGIIKVLYPSNSVVSGWAKRMNRKGNARDLVYRPNGALTPRIHREWIWAYRASVSMVRSGFDDGWRLGLVDSSSFWVTLSQDERLPFHSMAFDPSTFQQLGLYAAGVEESEVDDDVSEDLDSRFDFLAAYLPRPSDVYGTGGTAMQVDAAAFTTLLNLPFLIPFIVRVQAFMALIAGDKRLSQGDQAAFGIGNVIEVSARRDRLYDDAFSLLARTDNLRRRWRVSLWNEAGALEAGIDGGGVFREFLTQLLKEAVNPNRGLFQYTAHNTLFPNPMATTTVDYSSEQFYFVGKMLGKAVYENLLVDLAFAPFFLAQLLAVPYVPQLEDLRDLDPILHKNLLTVLEMTDPAEIDDLALDFSMVDDHVVGLTRVIGLGNEKIQGSQVTVENRTEYIKAYVEYKLVQEIKSPVKFLRQGFQEMVKGSWLSLFRSPLELQLILCGDQGPIDINDLEANTSYSGGYSPDHATIKIFWEVVHRFNMEDHQLLLKFVTSCSRPPVLGFRELNPKFCIQHGGTEERLPTASTCMNLLKLPEYSSRDIMKEKLLYAIKSAAGFELS